MERLATHEPAEGLHRVQLYSSGAEAVESALRLAKSYTGKNEFVSFWGGFHGKTMGVLSLMGSSFKDGLGPMMPGSHIVPYADCYRCPINATYPSCGIGCAEVARKQVKQESAGRIAAVIAEPMQGTNGNVIPPDEFLVAVKSIAEENGALFIADEMITGFGRTGKYWGVSHSGVTARHRHARQSVRWRLPPLRRFDDRRNLQSETLVQPVRIVVELRRQSARCCCRSRRLESDRRRSSSSKTARSRRRETCSRCSSPSSICFRSSVRCVAAACSSPSKW